MSEAGVVVYERKGRSLEGIWTHESIHGVVGREVVEDVEEGRFDGNWKVEIFLPTQAGPIYEGRLISEPLGSAYLLRWIGFRTANGSRQNFKGIGLWRDSGILVASFQEVVEA